MVGETLGQLDAEPGQSCKDDVSACALSQGQVYTALGSSAPHSMIVNTEWAPYRTEGLGAKRGDKPDRLRPLGTASVGMKWESVPRAGDGSCAGGLTAC